MCQYMAGERQHDAGPLPPSDPRQARRRLRGVGASAVPLSYASAAWSACTRACGGAGLQTRRVSCEVSGTLEYQLTLDERHCAARPELVKPNDMQDCGYVMCPMWETGPWSQVRAFPFYSRDTLSVHCRHFMRPSASSCVALVLPFSNL